MIPYKNRFHGHNSLDYIYRKGQTTRSRLLNIKSVPNKTRQNSRIAVVISKKVAKSAVKRNLVRRRIYNYIQQKINIFDGIRDVVITVTSVELLSMNHKELTDLMDQLFDQMGIFSKKQ